MLIPKHWVFSFPSRSKQHLDLRSRRVSSLDLEAEKKLINEGEKKYINFLHLPKETTECIRVSNKNISHVLKSSSPLFSKSHTIL